ncbi:MAG: LysR family transcriptional regulator [Alphaproteobacteria bacterium]|nr:LysR family transcriptional regulator [Alphaproteobacteria bacterium]NCQ67454.1 LysR family transcriptional regulator [Alphaproteobacteria bacterium]NCT08073.1 LysR family transcriptional regulator [Alphaproteobacteria bacterium]
MLYSEKIQYFIEIVRHGSFSRSAKHLNVATSTVTKAVTNLEKELGQTLVKRLKSGVEMTPIGQDLYESVIESYLTIEQKLNAVKNKGSQKRNSLKIITTTGTMSLWLMPRLAAFQKKYPDITLRLQTTDDHVSLSKTDADVAILPTIDDPGAVIKKKLLSVSVKLAASKSYIAQYGEPKTKLDLKNHRLISFYQSKDLVRGNVDWHLQNEDGLLKPALIINSAICIYYAALLGYGIAPISKEFPIEGDLIEILPDEPQQEVDVFFITPKKRGGDNLINDLYSSLVEPIFTKTTLSITGD